MKMKLTSPAFKDGEMIPKVYSGDGEDISPPLEWSDIPPGTQGLALISDDPDAPAGDWVHWVVYNIPPGERLLSKAVPPDSVLPNGALQGITDFQRIGYGGPMPPSGTHRYYFKLYALDAPLALGPGATKKHVLREMEGHILGSAQLMGRYKR